MKLKFSHPKSTCSFRCIRQIIVLQMFMPLVNSKYQYYVTVGASLIGLPFTPYIGTLLRMRFTAFCRQVFGCKGFLLNGTKLDLTKIPPLPPNELAVEWSDYLKASKTALLQINQAFNISFIVKEISNWSREGAQFV